MGFRERNKHPEIGYTTLSLLTLYFVDSCNWGDLGVGGIKRYWNKKRTRNTAQGEPPTPQENKVVKKC